MNIVIINGSPRSRYIFQSLVHKIIFSIGIKPFVEKKGDSYSGVISKWKKYGVISRS